MLLAQSSPFTPSYDNITTLHPLGLAAVIVLGIAMLVLPRRWAPLPMIIMACFVAPAQRIVVGGLDFSLLRIMILFGTVRILSWQEWRGFRWIALDWAIIAWAVVGTVAYTVQQGTPDALILKLGTSYDAIGMYFLFRCLIRSWEDIDRLALALTLVAFPVLVAFSIEKATGRNMFAIFGGVPEVTPIRQGRLRAQGAFSHPIVAGCFWAAAIPLIAARWWRPDWTARCLAAAGVGAALLIVAFTTSSTPVFGVLAGVLAAALFPLRHWMSWLRWGALGMLVYLHFAMKAPVWHLISRVDLVGGSTGWHRYSLIEQAIHRFSEWALVGTPSTAHWGWGLFDVTNQYVLEGVRGGVLTLAVFLAMIVIAFRYVGRLWGLAGAQPAKIAMAWAIGVSLVVHCTNFVGVSYFGQITMLWYLTLALAASVGAIVHRTVSSHSAIRRSSPLAASQDTVALLTRDS